MKSSNNFKCKYTELHCPYQGCINKNECTYFNVRSNDGNFGNRVCYEHEEILGNWIEITETSLPEKGIELLVKNKFGEIFDFAFWGFCDVLLSAKLMGIVYFKKARE